MTRVSVLDLGAEWTQCERELAAKGSPLGFFHTSAWARYNTEEGVSALLFSVRDTAGVCTGAFAVESHPVRTLPGHRILLVRRLGVGAGGLTAATMEDGLRALIDYARQNKTVLRVNVDVFAIDPANLARTRDLLTKVGFALTPSTRTYSRTVILDLSPAEAELMAALHRSARRNIRDAAKVGMTVEPPSLEMAPLIEHLDDETRERTGAPPRYFDWAATIRLNDDAAGLFRLLVARRADVTGPESVIAFSCARMHGDVAEYAESGSTRIRGINISTSYVLLWELIRWAKQNGARVFDLGGITPGIEPGSDDPLGGISEFKRRFSPVEADVGSEFSFEPRPARALLSGAVARGAGIIRRATARIAALRRQR